MLARLSAIPLLFLLGAAIAVVFLSWFAGSFQSSAVLVGLASSARVAALYVVGGLLIVAAGTAVYQTLLY